MLCAGRVGRLLAALGLLLTVLSGCGEPEPLKVGFLGNLTGRTADLGRAGRNGVLLALEECNAAGGLNGRMLELVVEDDRQDVAAARSAVRSLKAAGVVAIIGPMTSQMAVALQPTFEQQGLVSISPTVSTVSLSGKADHFFRVYPTCQRSAKALADYAFAEQGIRRYAIIADQSNQAFTASWRHCFTERVAALGGEVLEPVAFDARAEETSYLDLAAKVLDARPEGLLILASALDSAMLAQQVAKLDPDVALFASDWTHTGDLLSYGGRSVEGMVIVNSLDQSSQDPRFLDFKARYQGRFGTPPHFPAVFGYEAARMLLSALERDPSATQLRAALSDTPLVEGVQGPFRLDAYGDVARGIYLIKIENGAFRTLGKAG